MKSNVLGTMVAKKRKELGYTQQNLADYLHISFQAVSKWENGTAYPEIMLLPKIANFLGTSVDALLGYTSAVVPEYEERYKKEGYYWGLLPNQLCYEIMKLKPPVKPYHVLDIGCGEGKDAVFLAKNGYIVSAFDISETGIEKGKKLAEKNGVNVVFFKADIMEYNLEGMYDIIFSSGVFHYIKPCLRETFINNLKEHTNPGGINCTNVFVEKPFIEPAPDSEKGLGEKNNWRSGELFMYYYDWFFHINEEWIFDCNSGGVPHKHCMDTLIAEKPA